MIKFYLKLAVYLICFMVSLFALSGIDFNRFIRQGKIPQAQTLYVVVALIMAYLLGNFFMSIIYWFGM